jgi:hypothetical protein
MTAELLNKQPRLWDGRKGQLTDEDVARFKAWWPGFLKQLDESNKIEPLGDDFIDVCKGHINANSLG